MSAQDGGVHEPTIRLRLLLAFLRALAGRRGFSEVRWHNAGFRYALSVTRTPLATALELDVDPTAVDRDELIQRVRDALH